MIVAVGADHAGFALKATLARVIREAGHEVLDCGADREIPHDDYPDYSAAVARTVAGGDAERGVLVCGSGVGAAIAANKVAGARAALCHDTYSAHQGVEDDDMNVICFGARVVGPALAAELVRTFLDARFSGEERHKRRRRKVVALERAWCAEGGSAP